MHWCKTKRFVTTVRSKDAMVPTAWAQSGDHQLDLIRPCRVPCASPLTAQTASACMHAYMQIYACNTNAISESLALINTIEFIRKHSCRVLPCMRVPHLLRHFAPYEACDAVTGT